MPLTRPMLVRFAIGAVLVAGGVTAAEVGLRRAAWQYKDGERRDVVWSLERDRALARANDAYMFCPRTLWRPRPNAPIPWMEGERFNADGYRGPLLSAARPPKTLRMVALGGAGALGVGVAAEDTFVSLTARLLTSRTMRSEGMNLGVENYSMRQCLERYREVARPYRPHVVFLTVPTRSSFSPAPAGRTDDELIETYRPLDVMREHQPPAVADELRVVQGLHWLKAVTDGSYWSDRDFQFQLKRLEPTARRLDWPGVRRAPMPDFEGSMSLLLQETRQDGAHLVFIIWPNPPSSRVPPIQAAYDRAATEFGEREKLIVLDERNPHLAGLSAELMSTDVYGADRFPSACGHAAVAEALAELIVRGIAVKAAMPPPPKEPPPKNR